MHVEARSAPQATLSETPDWQVRLKAARKSRSSDDIDGMSSVMKVTDACKDTATHASASPLSDTSSVSKASDACNDKLKQSCTAGSCSLESDAAEVVSCPEEDFVYDDGCDTAEDGRRVGLCELGGICVNPQAELWAWYNRTFL